MSQVHVQLGSVTLSHGPRDPVDVDPYSPFVTALMGNGARAFARPTYATLRRWTLTFESLDFLEYTAVEDFYLATGPGPLFDYTHTDGETYRVRFCDVPPTRARRNKLDCGMTLVLESFDQMDGDAGPEPPDPVVTAAPPTDPPVSYPPGADPDQTLPPWTTDPPPDQPTNTPPATPSPTQEPGGGSANLSGMTGSITLNVPGSLTVGVTAGISATWTFTPADDGPQTAFARIDVVDAGNRPRTLVSYDTDSPANVTFTPTSGGKHTFRAYLITGRGDTVASDVEIRIVSGQSSDLDGANAFTSDPTGPPQPPVTQGDNLFLMASPTGGGGPVFDSTDYASSGQTACRSSGTVYFGVRADARVEVVRIIYGMDRNNGDGARLSDAEPFVAEGESGVDPPFTLLPSVDDADANGSSTQSKLINQNFGFVNYVPIGSPENYSDFSGWTPMFFCEYWTLDDTTGDRVEKFAQTLDSGVTWEEWL